MKKLSMKKGILLVIMVTAIIFAISTNVFASSPITFEGLEGINGGGSTTDGTNNGTSTGTGTNNGTSTGTGTNNGTTGTGGNVTPNTPSTPTQPSQGNGDGQNTTGSTYDNTTLPQTGDASDYAIFMLIVVAGVIAVYTYRKVKQYNI